MAETKLNKARILDDSGARRTSTISEEHLAKVNYVNILIIVPIKIIRYCCSIRLYMYCLLFYKLKTEYLALDENGDGDISEVEMIGLLKSLKRKLSLSEKAITID